MTTKAGLFLFPNIQQEKKNLMFFGPVLLRVKHENPIVHFHALCAFSSSLSFDYDIFCHDSQLLYDAMTGRKIKLCVQSGGDSYLFYARLMPLVTVVPHLRFYVCIFTVDLLSFSGDVIFTPITVTRLFYELNSPNQKLLFGLYFQNMDTKRWNLRGNVDVKYSYLNWGLLFHQLFACLFFALVCVAVSARRYRCPFFSILYIIYFFCTLICTVNTLQI